MNTCYAAAMNPPLELRRASSNEIIDWFLRITNNDEKNFFTAARHIGMSGERQAFRAVIEYLSFNHPKVAMDLLLMFPIMVGRWDSVLYFIDTPLQNEALGVIKAQLEMDIRYPKCASLCAKWMPSINASSPKTRRLARIIAAALNMTHEQYRKTLSAIREKLDIVERKMSANEWQQINYAKVPKLAKYKYRKAFVRHNVAPAAFE